jgi:spermidine/putrescine transport system substrate-binding protein
MTSYSRRTFLKLGALAAGTLATSALAACRPDIAEAPTLNLYNWIDYLNPDTITGFTRTTGISVYYLEFESNEELFNSLRNNPEAYDLIVPSDFMVRRMQEEGLLRRLDPQLIPNFKNVQERFRTGRPYDLRSEYSVTKDWGTTGLIWRPDRVPEPIRSSADFWAAAPRHSGRITVIDAQDEVIGLALKMLGYPLNDTDPAHLAEAEQKLMELRPHVVITSDYIDKFAQNTVVMAIGWNGDAAQINANKDTPVNYIVPSEGSVLWEDDWCIPATALHPENAHAFINYVLQPQVAAAECEYTGYATVVEEALSLLPPEVLNDPMIFPAEANLLNSEFQALPDDGEVRQQRAEVWARFVEDG